MTLALQLGAAILWWAALCVAAVLCGSFTVWFGFYLADAWRDRKLCKRAESLIDPQVRTLVADLDRIWRLDCAPDRNVRDERLSLVAELYDWERRRVIEMDGRLWG